MGGRQRHVAARTVLPPRSRMQRSTFRETRDSLREEKSKFSEGDPTTKFRYLLRSLRLI